MKQYKNRYLRKISNAINVAYLSTAILWGFATFNFSNGRAQLNKTYSNGELSREEYLAESMKFTEQEKDVFSKLSLGLLVTFGCDVTMLAATFDKEL